MARAHGFEDLKVWQLARELVLAVYQLTSTQVFGKDHALRTKYVAPQFPAWQISLKGLSVDRIEIS